MLGSQRSVPLRVGHSLSAILALAYKEAMVLRHDRALIGMVFVQPVAWLLLFGFVLSNTPRNVPWVVLDRSQSALSRRLVREIEATGYFLSPRVVASYADGEAFLRHGRALVMVVAPPSLERDVEMGSPTIEVLSDGSDPLSAARVSDLIRQVATHMDLQRRDARTRLDRELALRQDYRFNDGLRERDSFMSILAGMLLSSYCLSVSSLGLLVERESGSYEHLLSLPTRPVELVLGKLLPYVGVGLIIFTMAIVGVGLVFDQWPRGSGPALVLVTVLFIFVSLAVGTLFSTLSRSSSQAVFLGVFFVLPSFILSGSLFPYQLMPEGIRQLGGLLPLRWYQLSLKEIALRGGGLSEVVDSIAALSGMLLVVLLAIHRRLQPRLD